MDRYAGRRFAGFIISVSALIGAIFWGPPESFATFAQTVGIVYGAYLTGQSTTDFVKAKNGS